jgi:hypothetical protein
MFARRVFITLLVVCTSSVLLPLRTAGRQLVGIAEFAHLMRGLSEPEGYFDTDNFISNERSYLKIIPDLKRKCVPGGAYVGVGPDQNYSYIAEVQPRIAIIIDIRRQNVLEHLYFKSLFQLSWSRAQFLERLFGRNINSGSLSSGEIALSELLQRIDKAPQDNGFENAKEAEAIWIIQSWNLDLTKADYVSIHYVARAFIENGLELKFSSYNRPPRPYYPSYRQLLLETDPKGIQSNYLASEERFRFIKQLHEENRIVPIVGDLGGEEALRKSAEELRKRKIPVTCLYVSNVEFYLFGTDRWNKYVQNISKLPRDPGALLIRSYADSWRPALPQIPGYYMGTLLTSIAGFLNDEFAGNNKSYWDLVMRAR